MRSSFTVGQLGRMAQLSLCLLLAFVAGNAWADISFVPGDYYTSKIVAFTQGDPALRTITQYDPTWQPVGQLIIPIELADEIRGVAFGPDNLLYVTVVKGFLASVLALDNSGTIQQTYPIPVTNLGGGAIYGRIALDRQHLYLGGPALVRFSLGNPLSGAILPTLATPNEVKPLPNGNLLVAMSSRIDELTVDGALVRNIPLVTTPFNFFNDVQGVEFDPMTNSIFVTHLGYSGFASLLMRIDATSGVLEKDVFFKNPLDILLDLSGDLVVTSAQFDQVPAFFTHDLDAMGTLGEEQQFFVTRFVPWPSFDNLPATPLVQEASGPGGAAVNFSLSSTDLEGNPNMISTSPPSGTTFPIGTTNVECTAVDRQSHTTPASLAVVVQDTTSPTIIAPVSVRVKKQKSRKGQPPGAIVNYANQLFATDVVDGIVEAFAAPPSGSFFPVGMTTVEVTATDSRGNQGNTRFSVIVANNVPKPKMPTVNLSVSRGDIEENQDAAFTVRANTINPSQPVRVQYEVSGTAIPPNEFYTLSVGDFIIPSGDSSAAVTVHAVANPLASGSETIVMTLTRGSGYKIGKTSVATLTIHNQ